MQKKTIFIIFLVLVLAVLALSIPAFAASPIITFENIKNGDMISISPGDRLDFKVSVTSDTPFVQALLISDQYYPGRGIFLSGSDIVTQETSASLELSATGKNSTANLDGVAGCPDEYAPVGLVAVVRYKGGIVVSERIDFCIQVK